MVYIFLSSLEIRNTVMQLSTLKSLVIIIWKGRRTNGRTRNLIEMHSLIEKRKEREKREKRNRLTFAFFILDFGGISSTHDNCRRAPSAPNHHAAFSIGASRNGRGRSSDGASWEECLRWRQLLPEIRTNNASFSARFFGQ